MHALGQSLSSSIRSSRHLSMELGLPLPVILAIRARHQEAAFLIPINSSSSISISSPSRGSHQGDYPVFCSRHGASAQHPPRFTPAATAP